MQPTATSDEPAGSQVWDTSNKGSRAFNQNSCSLWSEDSGLIRRVHENPPSRYTVNKEQNNGLKLCGEQLLKVRGPIQLSWAVITPCASLPGHMFSCVPLFGHMFMVFQTCGYALDAWFSNLMLPIVR